MSQQPFCQALNLEAPPRPEAKLKALEAAAAVDCQTEGQNSPRGPFTLGISEAGQMRASWPSRNYDTKALATAVSGDHRLVYVGKPGLIIEGFLEQVGLGVMGLTGWDLHTIVDAQDSILEHRNKTTQVLSRFIFFFFFLGLSFI